jgi:hypothetical protein
MEKIYGTKQRQDCLVRTGRSKWILFFGFWKDDEKSESGWEYRHTFNRKPTLSEVKEIVVSAINKTTEEKIINGFVWNKKPIYLSPENQLNFSAIERSENIPYPKHSCSGKAADTPQSVHPAHQTPSGSFLYDNRLNIDHHINTPHKCTKTQ